jgi:hypothetical protein
MSGTRTHTQANARRACLRNQTINSRFHYAVNVTGNSTDTRSGVGGESKQSTR